MNNPANPTTSEAQQCVLMSCSAREGLEVQRVVQNICNVPVRDQGPIVLAVTITFSAIALIICAIRLGVRARSWALLGLDDVFIFIAAVRFKTSIVSFSSSSPVTDHFNWLACKHCRSYVAKKLIKENH